MIFEKIRIDAGKTKEREIRFLNIPIIQYGRKEKYGILEKYIEIFPESLVKKYLHTIYKSLPNKYDLVFILRCNALGENYLLTYLYEEVMMKKGAKNACFILHGNNARYLDILKMFADVDIFITDIPLTIINTIFTKFVYKFDGTEFHIHHCPLSKTADFLSFKTKEHYTKTIMRYAGATKYKSLNCKINNNMISQVCSKIIGLNKEKFVFIIPECKSLIPLSETFWENLCNLLKLKGYDIYINSRAGINDFKVGITADLTLSDALCLASLAQGIIGMRSGFSEILTTLRVPMHIIYNNSIFGNANDILVSKIFTLKDYPNSAPQKIFEYCTSNNTEEHIINSILERF